MLYFANPCGDEVVDKMIEGVLGFIDTPAQQNLRPAGIKWCADNGCFSARFDEKKWWRFLEKHAHEASTCLFATAPDVVGDAAATLDRSRPWLPRIRSLGYPAAFVAQNGQESLVVPWDEFDALFIGGTVECREHGPRLDAIKTGRGAHQKFYCPECRVQIFEWKLSQVAAALVTEAKARGKWVHMGRVSSKKRYDYARSIGCDSVDGTYLRFGPRVNLPKLLSWLVPQVDNLGMESA